jgi:aldose 1-epimerase
MADVVLGFDDERKYADGSSPYFGAIAGRFANRIANATFELDGKRYSLSKNERGFPGSLHGGARGFDKVEWEAEHLDRYALKHRRRGDAVRLRYRSADGEEGYPGTLEVEIVYTLLDTEASGTQSPAVGELVQSITATVSGSPTVINLAQHSYFNLAGHGSGSVLAHELTLPTAKRMLPVDAHRIPTGRFAPVAGTPFDFLSPRRIGDRLEEVDGPGWHAGLDHCFVLHGIYDNEQPPQDVAMAPMKARRRQIRAGAMPPPDADAGWWLERPEHVATLHEPASGRTMRVSTTAPGLQVYTSNFLDGSIVGKGGARYDKYGGVCLETESLPNGPNHGATARSLHSGQPARTTTTGGAVPWYPSGILRPGEQYRHTTIYRFEVE